MLGYPPVFVGMRTYKTSDFRLRKKITFRTLDFGPKVHNPDAPETKGAGNFPPNTPIIEPTKCPTHKNSLLEVTFARHVTRASRSHSSLHSEMGLKRAKNSEKCVLKAHP